MGFISDLVSNSKASFPLQRGSVQGRQLWNQIFGSTNKEQQQKPDVAPNGGSWGRSSISTQNATKRLIQALRSNAPGGWTDDRWEQAGRHYNGIPYIAIHRQCELLTQAEFQIYIKDPHHEDGKRPVTPDDEPHGDKRAAFNIRPYDLVKLLEKPNNEDSFGDLVSCWSMQMDLTGMALTFMVPSEAGIPCELYPIPTATAIPQPQINPEFPHGFYRIQPLYPYGPFSSYPTPNSSVGAAIGAEWMMKMKYPHPLLRYDGYSPLTAMRFHLDEIEMMDKSRHYSMRRGINPSAVLNMSEVEGMENGLSEPEIERIKTEFENEQMGPENNGKLHVAFPGATLEPWGGRPVDMDYQAGWDQLTSFAFGGFGITKPAAGMIDDSSYSTLFATLKQLYWQTLDPKVNRFGQKMTRFLAPFFGDNIIVEVRCKRLDDHDVINGKIDKVLQMKGFPPEVIAYLLRMLELPTEKKMMEVLSKAGQEQAPPGGPGMPGADGAVPGMEGAEEEQPLPGNLSGENEVPEIGQEEEIPQEEEPDEIEASRPSPGNLSQGALGPKMKNLNNRIKSITPKKSLSLKALRKKYSRSRNGFALNGHH